MPTTNARKHLIPAGTDTSITRATIFQAFGNSIRDVVTVANTTARSQLVADLVAAGEGPSATKALVVYRHDAPGLSRLEYTFDGTVWLPASGLLRFANDAARDSWTTSNSGLLAVGDRVISNNVEFTWAGSTWVISGVTQGTYSPTLSRATLGNGSIQSTWTKAGTMVTVQGSLTLGSTTTIDGPALSATVGITLPFTAAAIYGVAGSNYALGVSAQLDNGSQIYTGQVLAEASTTSVKIYASGVAGSFIARSPVNSAAPFAWTTGDILSWQFAYVSAA